MNFVINSDKLYKTLSSISAIKEAKPSIPILNSYQFNFLENNLIIKISDIESTISTNIQLENEEEFSICIPIDILLETLKSFDNQLLSIFINKETFEIEITSDSGKFNLVGEDGNEFPDLPQIEYENEISLNSEYLYRGISKTVFACAQNNTQNPAVNGVFFEFTDNKLVLVATDTHKLVFYELLLDSKIQNDSNFIIFTKPLNALKNILLSSEFDVKLFFNKENAKFEIGNTTIICKMLTGNYPKYKNIIPNNADKIAVVDKKTLLNILKRVSIFSSKSTYLIYLNFKGSELDINTEDQDYYNKANEKITCNYNGEDLSIGLNSKFTVETINYIDSENIIFNMVSENQPLLLNPENTDYENEKYNVILLPISIR